MKRPELALILLIVAILLMACGTSAPLEGSAGNSADEGKLKDINVQLGRLLGGTKCKADAVYEFVVAPKVKGKIGEVQMSWYSASANGGQMTNGTWTRTSMTVTFSAQVPTASIGTLSPPYTNPGKIYVYISAIYGNQSMEQLLRVCP
jgi:hypothetical protein